MKRMWIKALAAAAILVAAFVVYQFYDPTHSELAPKCAIKTLTGYSCPGCGCQRLLYQWANGHFIEGLRYNYFFAVGLGYIALIVIGRVYAPIGKFCRSRWTVYTFIGLFFGWWVLRNILGI